MKLDKVLIRNIFSLVSLQGLGYLLPLITLPYLVRVLGISSYGSLAFTLAIINYFSLLVDFGFDWSATKQIAENQESRSKISQVFWDVLWAKVVLASAGFLILFVLSQTIPSIYEIRTLLYLACLIVLANTLFPSWLFQGKERMGWATITNITARILTIPLLFVFVKTSNDIWVVIALQVLTAFLAAVGALYIVKKNDWITYKPPSFRGAANQINAGRHIFISTTAVSLYTTSTTVILGLMTTPEAVGIFSAADKLRQAAQGVLTPISQAIYPRLNALASKSHQEAVKLLKRLLIIQSLLGVAVSTGLFMGAELLVTNLYGDEFKDAIPLLKLMSLLPLIISINNIFGVQTLLVFGFKIEFSRVLLFSGIAHLCALIPLVAVAQQTGASIAILSTELIVTIGMFVYILKLDIPLFRTKKQ